MQPSAAVLRLQTMNEFDTAFFAAEAAAQAAAENTVDRLYARAGQERNAQAAIATAVVIGVGLAATAAWKSPLGVKIRSKVAKAIAPN